MEISINWDESGFKHENVFDLICFALNKEGTCKNKTGVVGLGLPKNDFGISYKSILPIGANNPDSKCVTLEINENELPFYCKEIMIFAYTNNLMALNAKFSDLEIFNVFKDGEKIFSIESYDKNTTTGILHLCSLVRMPEGFVFSPVFQFINKNIVELGKSFNIEFINEEDESKISSNKGGYSRLQA